MQPGPVTTTAHAYDHRHAGTTPTEKQFLAEFAPASNPWKRLSYRIPHPDPNNFYRIHLTTGMVSYAGLDCPG